MILGMICFFVALYLATGPDATGDTPVYVGDVLRYLQTGHAPLTFWDFGHLLWRPSAYALWHMAAPLTRWLYGDNPVIELTAMLFAVNFVSGVALTVLAFAISRRLGLNNLLACCSTAAVLLCNAILNYVHSGCSYVPGVTLQFLGFWLILRALQNPAQRTLSATGAGIALSLSFALWFPFCLGVPAALVLMLFWKAPAEREAELEIQRRMQLALRVGIVIAIAGAGLFTLGAVMAHVSSVNGLKEWVANSGHGVHPERRFLRFPTGVTRTFFFLGDEGITIKRFVFGDPYAPVRWTDLLTAGLWKVAVVFALFLALFWSLWKTRPGRSALLVVLSGVVPTLLFALFLFETGQSERYLPFYAALLVGVSAALTQRPYRRPVGWVLGIFVLLLAVVNLKAFSVDLRTTAKESALRMMLVHEHTQHGGVALLLSFRDPVSSYFQRSPFDPENRPGALSLYHVIEQERSDVGGWKTQSACRVLAAWHESGEAWISKRLVAPKPDADWGWVEHDVRTLSWSDLDHFFVQFDTDGDIGGRDGFLRLAASKRNQYILGTTCVSAKMNR